jgi:hypothetical protein
MPASILCTSLFDPMLYVKKICKGSSLSVRIVADTRLFDFIYCLLPHYKLNVQVPS